MEKTSLTVIVPVFNEEYLVEQSLKRLFVLKENPLLSNIQVIIVNDHSSDRTEEALNKFALTLRNDDSAMNWKFISHEKNYGKGRAIRTALKYAENEITVIHDADLEYHPKDILRMIPLFLSEGADAVYGSRFFSHDFRRILMFRHQLGNKFLTFISNLVSNLNLSDMETCYKAVKTSLIKSIPLISNDFRIEPELTIKLAKRKAKIFEIPISYSGRTYSEGKKINWRDGFKAIGAIIRFGFTDNIFNEDEFGSQILSRLSRAQNFNLWLAETVSPYVGKKVLEIGAGIGNLTLKLTPRQEYHATDINPLYLQIIENLQHNKPYLKVSFLDVNDTTGLTATNNIYDTIICLNVIEHVENDSLALRNIANLLEKGGKAIIMVPKGQWLYGSLDKVLGHKRRYSEKLLYDLAHQTGFKIAKLIYFNKISTLPWYFNGKILKRRTFGYWQILIMDTIIPIAKIFDKIVPMPALSFIAIFEKK